MKKVVYLAMFIISIMALPALVSAQEYGRITVQDPATGEIGTCYKAHPNAICVDYQPLYQSQRERTRNLEYNSTYNRGSRPIYNARRLDRRPYQPYSNVPQQDLRTNQRYDDEYEVEEEDLPPRVEPARQTQRVNTIRKSCTGGRGQYYGIFYGQCTIQSETTTLVVTTNDRNFNPNIVVRQTYWTNYLY